MCTDIVEMIIFKDVKDGDIRLLCRMNIEKERANQANLMSAL